LNFREDYSYRQFVNRGNPILATLLRRGARC
jgi:hypothetical protein